MTLSARDGGPGRGSRSHATRQKLIDAAFEILARPETYLGSRALGLKRQTICDAAGQLASTFNYHFGSKSRETFVDAVGEALHQQLADEAATNRDGYRLAIDAVRAGAGREVVHAALVHDLVDYGAVTDGRRGRERLYYLMLALSDVRPHVSDATYGERVQRVFSTIGAMYRSVYEQFADVADREFVDDVDRTRVAIQAYLEGVSVLRRLQAAPSEEEIVDNVLRLFLVTTKPRGGADIDVDEQLFGRRAADADTTTGGQATVHATRDQLYIEVAQAIEAASPDEALHHCALHSPLPETTPPRDELAERLFAAHRRHMNAGKPVRRIATFSTVEQLDAHVAWLKTTFDATERPRIEACALIADAAPGFSPLVVGDRFAALGREDHTTGHVVDGATFRDRRGVDLCRRGFDAIWHDSRSYRIASPSGLDERGIADARRRLADR